MIFTAVIHFLLAFIIPSADHSNEQIFKMDPRFSDETRAYVQQAMQNTSSQSNTSEVEAVRKRNEDIHQNVNKKLIGTFKGTLQEKTIKANCAEIPITIYTPIDANKDKLGIFFHGGGWVACSLQSHQPAVNSMADATKTIWISVGYRLAPEYKYPIWLDDACDAVQHIIQNKTAYGVNEAAKIGVAGNSAGGTIAASVARTIKGVDFQILIYAAIDILHQTASYTEFTDKMYILTPTSMDWCLANAFRSADDYKDPRVSFLLNTSFEGTPPCLFIVAELDILRDGNIEYNKLLEKAGVHTKFVLIKGVVHTFFSLLGAFPKASAEAIDAMQDFMGSI